MKTTNRAQNQIADLAEQAAKYNLQYSYNTELKLWIAPAINGVVKELISSKRLSQLIFAAKQKGKNDKN